MHSRKGCPDSMVKLPVKSKLQAGSVGTNLRFGTVETASSASSGVATRASGGGVGEGSRQAAQTLPGPASVSAQPPFGNQPTHRSGSVVSTASGGGAGEGSRQAAGSQNIHIQSLPGPVSVATPHPFGNQSGSVATHQSCGFLPIPAPNYSYPYTPSPMAYLPVPLVPQLQTVGSPYPPPYFQYPPQYSPPLWIPNNANPGVQGGFPQQQLSLQYKYESNNVLSSAQKMFNAFPGQNIRPTLIADPFGAIHAVDTQTNKCYWTAETGRSAFKFVKDKDQVLDSYFEFRGNGSRVAGDLIDENELVHFTKNGQQPVKLEVNTVESLEQTVFELYGPQCSEFRVTGDIKSFWIHCRTGDMLKYCPMNQEEFLLMLRFDYKIVDRVNNWQFCFSVFILLMDGQEVDNTIDIIHCRTYKRYLCLMQIFHIQLEELMVFYDKRRQWDDGKVTYEGRLNTPVRDSNAEFTFVTAELLQKAEDKKKTERYLHMFRHQNIVNFHGAYECQEDVFLVFESFSNDLAACGYGPLNAGYIIRAVLSGVLHLFEKKCLHGNLIAQNVVITAENKVKLYGLLPDALSSKPAMEKEIVALGKLLNWCANEDTDYNSSKDPLAFNLLDKLNSRRLSMSQLKKHPILWKPRRILKFILDFTIALDSRSSRADGKKLYDVFAVEAFQNLILKRRKNSMHKIFLEHMEHACMYRSFRTLALNALLRFIRNAFNHEPQLDKEVRKLYGESFEGLEKYFSEIFPYLLVEIYSQVELVAVEGGDFHSYFF